MRNWLSEIWWSRMDQSNNSPVQLNKMLKQKLCLVFHIDINSQQLADCTISMHCMPYFLNIKHNSWISESPILLRASTKPSHFLLTSQTSNFLRMTAEQTHADVRRRLTTVFTYLIYNVVNRKHWTLPTLRRELNSVVTSETSGSMTSRISCHKGPFFGSSMLLPCTTKQAHQSVHEINLNTTGIQTRNLS